MAKDSFEFSCPCCGKRIEVNVRSGRARAVRFEESEKGKDLDGLLADQGGEKARLREQFGDAIDQQKRRRETLDDLFESAREEAEKDKDTKPFRPFDLD